MKTYLINLILFSSFLYMSCEDVVDVNVDEGVPVLVVEGWITTVDKPYEVRLSKTAPYFKNEQTPPASGASVIIRDNEGTTDTLKEVAPGHYRTAGSRTGKIGNHYTLFIVFEGETYTAMSEIKRVPVIDSLAFRYADKSGTEDDGYYLNYYGPEPEGQGDYYRFNISIDNKMQPPKFDWFVSGDEWVDGNYIADLEAFDDPMRNGDMVKAEIMSITKDAYYYFTEMKIQVDNGGMFSNPPSNIRTNIQNMNPASSKKAVGYFGASAVRSKEIVFK
jgi:hypothetical protein